MRSIVIFTFTLLIGWMSCAFAQEETHTTHTHHHVTSKHHSRHHAATHHTAHHKTSLHTQHKTETHAHNVPIKSETSKEAHEKHPPENKKEPAKETEKPTEPSKHISHLESAKHHWHHYFSEHHWHEHHWHNPHLIRRTVVYAEETEHGIVALIHKAIDSLHHTHYRYGGNYFDMSSGIYELDCSDYVDDLLRISQPRAYNDLSCSTHTSKPTSRDYFRFFNNLSDNSGHAWQRVDDVESLKAGDILVFQNYGGGGHVMVVMGIPTPALGNDNTYFVKVSDSASSRHSDDTRPAHVSGVGIGTLLLRTDPDSGEPLAYAWTVDSGWDNVRIAMAEPIGNTSPPSPNVQ